MRGRNCCPIRPILCQADTCLLGQAKAAERNQQVSATHLRPSGCYDERRIGEEIFSTCPLLQLVGDFRGQRVQNDGVTDAGVAVVTWKLCCLRLQPRGFFYALFQKAYSQAPKDTVGAAISVDSIPRNWVWSPENGKYKGLFDRLIAIIMLSASFLRSKVKTESGAELSIQTKLPI